MMKVLKVLVLALAVVGVVGGAGAVGTMVGGQRNDCGCGDKCKKVCGDKCFCVTPK